MIKRPTDHIDERVDIERYVRGLSLQKQRMVRLVVRGYTYGEISLKMGISEDAVKKTMQRVRDGYSELRSC